MSILNSIEGFLATGEHAVAAEVSKLSGDGKIALHTGVAVVDVLNDIVQNPVVDIVASLTGGLGDTIVTDLKAVLPKIAADLQLGEDIVGSTDPNVILQGIVSVIQGKLGLAKNIDLHRLAILISTDISKGVLTWSEAAQLAEWYYKNAYPAVKAAA